LLRRLLKYKTASSTTMRIITTTPQISQKVEKISARVSRNADQFICRRLAGVGCGGRVAVGFGAWVAVGGRGVAVGGTGVGGTLVGLAVCAGGMVVGVCVGAAAGGTVAVGVAAAGNGVSVGAAGGAVGGTGVSVGGSGVGVSTGDWNRRAARAAGVEEGSKATVIIVIRHSAARGKITRHAGREER